jgi:hypothetical protein
MESKIRDSKSKRGEEEGGRGRIGREGERWREKERKRKKEKRN